MRMESTADDDGPRGNDAPRHMKIVPGSVRVEATVSPLPLRQVPKNRDNSTAPADK
jgi:hypothetical protein